MCSSDVCGQVELHLRADNGLPSRTSDLPPHRDSSVIPLNDHEQSETQKPLTSTSRFQLASTSRGPATVSQNFRGPAPESRQRDFPRVRRDGLGPMSLRRRQARPFCLEDAVVFVAPAPADAVLRGPPLWPLMPRVVIARHACRWCSHTSSASARSGTKRSLSTLRFTEKNSHTLHRRVQRRLAGGGRSMASSSTMT